MHTHTHTVTVSFTLEWGYCVGLKEVRFNCLLFLCIWAHWCCEAGWQSYFHFSLWGLNLCGNVFVSRYSVEVKTLESFLLGYHVPALKQTPNYCHRDKVMQPSLCLIFKVNTNGGINETAVAARRLLFDSPCFELYANAGIITAHSDDGHFFHSHHNVWKFLPFNTEWLWGWW